MRPLSYTKQVWESRILEIDCTDTLPSNVTISSVTAVVYDSVGTDVSAAMIEGLPSIVHPSVFVQIMGGTSGQNYNLRIRLTLSNFELAEDDITIYVRDVSL